MTRDLQLHCDRLAAFPQTDFFLDVAHPDTNPAGQELASVNFCITKLADAQSARLNLW